MGSATTAFTLINAPTLITPPPKMLLLKIVSYMLKNVLFWQILLKIGVLSVKSEKLSVKSEK